MGLEEIRNDNRAVKDQTTEELLKKYDELWEYINGLVLGDYINDFEDIIRELDRREEEWEYQRK